MNAHEAIRDAEALLPGVPFDEGEDSRWQAIIVVAEYIESEPELVWQFVRRWGAHPQEDLRAAIGTCVLEHLLEAHFAAYFPLVEELSLTEPLFGDTFLGCWPFGQATDPGNAERFDALRRRLLEAVSAKI